LTTIGSLRRLSVTDGSLWGQHVDE